MFDEIETVQVVKRKLISRYDAIMLTLGGVMSNIVDFMSTASDAISYVMPQARQYLSEYESMIDPSIYKTIGAVMVVLGLTNLFLKFRRRDVLVVPTNKTDGSTQ